MSQIFYTQEGDKVKILVMRLGTMKGRISVTPATLGSVRVRRETSVHQNCRSRLRLRCKAVAVRLPGMDRHYSLGRPRLQYLFGAMRRRSEPLARGALGHCGREREGGAEVRGCVPRAARGGKGVAVRPSDTNYRGGCT